jgi:molybdenum cofactor cytidylyltransferase
MGRPKAGLPFGQTGETVLSRIVSALLAGGAPNVVVVAGAHLDAIRAAMPPHQQQARVVEHPLWAQGQLSSLLAGLAAVDDPQLEGVLVTPVDVPLVTPATVAAVIAAWRTTRQPIVRPVDASTSLRAGPSTSLRASRPRHGHPVMFDRAIFADLRAADPQAGAKAVFAIHRDRILNVEVQDPGAFEDIDTPEDYEKLLKLLGSGATTE